jgi:hypothetical protein
MRCRIVPYLEIKAGERDHRLVPDEVVGRERHGHNPLGVHLG